MSESVLEIHRYAQEELERLSQAIVDRQVASPKAIRERLRLEHQSSHFIKQIRDTSERLLKIYETGNELRQQEIARISRDESLDNFYKELDEIRDFHHRYPDHGVENFEQLYAIKPSETGTDEIDTLFRGEEMYGRFMDLNELYEEFVNLKSIEPISYLEYLSRLDDFNIVPKSEKNHSYATYLRHLYEYLSSFFQRTHPLKDINRMVSIFQTEFDITREAGLPGQTVGDGQANGTSSGQYCEACERFYQKKSVYDAHLPSKKHKKAVERLEAQKSSNPQNTTVSLASGSISGRPQEIPALEFIIKKLLGVLEEERQATRENVVRRQTLTASERLAEIRAAEQEAIEASVIESKSQNNEDEQGSDEEGEEKIYNPLKLPIGWDGKPIPFWLWKLHGLGKEFPCEVCGNFVYMGRKAFDKHFTEQRHIYGLKCLGISPSPLFNQIVSIDEALQLWQKVKAENRKQETSMANLNEMEDDEGNVMSEKVYNDLRAQGLL
ncbi:U2 snRNP-associated protein sap61 [Schizosaccharomyces cryophilus OY26]|uniref:U2 snRNP-associated protein sap61 n=1 Tax=Schizosaccharomyces cryophilus (strain OY26 / ATCC MYA-4695 / CBS 11777 / NBRC 106824 / NRRL Y48691) TaxID=653667 RepID=S9XAT7_SCHCR|nr:U2 snRNP-associated protein sap61 [Schizosaccharomyces cryophilus OY26]EPY54267.1 U2 snRNP-associated protein sap61 [Schizosaccharomyces cryophilus OY26]